MKIETSTANIKKNILRYLDLALPVKKAMQKPIAHAFDQFQEGCGDYADNGLDFIKEPYLELATVYQEAAETLADLARPGGDLELEVARAFAKYLLDTNDARPEQVKLYTHQLGSLRSVNRGRNLVVCTGTGSGKTECFLLPIVNAIYKQRKEAELQGVRYDEHVRALILYPMNALVNDQIRRLRKLLKDLPVTFGRYTSETNEKMSALRDAESFSEIWRAGAEAGYMTVDGDVHVDEDYLENEYRDRARWSSGGADILVTNFAMLERLLLLPNQTLFNKPWDFIVLDEAHSYSGAAGTEIAWLIRRLRHRIDPNNEHDVRFLATSATLSTSADAETRERNTREFAASLFPAETDSFDVYGGDEEHFVVPENNNGNDAYIFNNAVEELCADTVAFEAKKANHKLAEKRIKLLTQVQEFNGSVVLSQIDELDSGLFQRHPEVIHGGVPVEGDEVNVSEEIRWLSKLMLTFSRDSEPYRGVLHDEMDGRRSEKPNDNNRLGNRLSLLEVWKNLANDNVTHPQTIHLETVLYLYRALEMLLQPEVRVEDAEDLAQGSIQNVKVHLTPRILDQIPDKINGYRQEERDLAEQESGIFQRWQGHFPGSNGEKYREWIYNAIVARGDVSRFFSAAERPNSVSRVAADAGMDLATMGRIMEVGAFAYPRGKRRPLIDVRFHQVVRDISHIGVYFRNGNPVQPVFVHSEDEYAATGEKIFGLGVCRRCGQPYLLGYGRDRHDGGGNGVIDMSLSRFPVGECKHLHAFTLNAPSDMDDNTEDRSHGIFIDLRTGNVTRNANPQHDGTELYWLIGHDNERGDEFLSPCNACGGNAVATANYGIITPYEATGIQFKIATLEAFARETNPDPDAGIQGNAPAGGRKILAFADSRSGAASLAFSFDRAIQTEYCDELVQRLRAAFNGTIDEAAAMEIAIQAFAAKGVRFVREQLIGNPIMRQFMGQRDAVVQDLVCTPNMENEFARLVATDHYERLLSLERDNGEMVDEATVSKLRVLKALAAGNRRVGLLPQQKLTIKSKMIKDLTRHDNDFDFLFGEPFGVIPEVDMKAILQEIYSHLVCSKKIQFENDDLKNAFYRWEPKDNFTRATIAPQAWRENHAVLRIVSRRLTSLGLNNVTHPQVLNLLGGVWTIFERLLQANGNTYVFVFSRLCADLIVEPGENFQENIAEEDKILPLVIQEHTAQIDSKIGAVYQRAFSEGKINILSCSTTFEMGVDVGSLNNVFLGNMPPSTANYKQRAGRAGRRPGAAPWILTLCGSQSSYDRDRYEDPAKLFFGEIDPPRLYLDRPQFAARHFRAEALHKFLEWIKDNKWTSNNQDEKAAARNWKKISYFLMGRISRKVQNQNAETFQARTLPCTCCSWLSDWQESNRDAVGDFVSGIYGYQGDFLANLPHNEGYSPVDDVVFQLEGMEGFFGKAGEPGLAYFRGLGGCNIPEMDGDGRLLDNRRPKWRSLKDRLEWKFRLLADGDDGMIDDEIMNHGWPENKPLSLSQSKLLWGPTIDALSDACVLPRYGFPVDTIKLVTQNDDGDAYGIELSRPIHLGMYEYAPGQSVYANKRRYESRGAKVYRFNNGDANLVANAQGTILKFCDSCHKVFYHGEENCPCCQGETRNQTFVTPELFIARKGSINPPLRHDSRGKRVVSWSGQVSGRSQHVVEGMSLLVAEPTERAVHYVNSQVIGHNWYYLCEVPTNVVLWVPGFWNQDPLFAGWTPNRIANAFTSAMYALRKSMSIVMRINERDVGGLVQAYSPGDGRTSFWFVFFDADNGGGSGCVIDLLLRGADDVEGRTRIRAIVEAAIDNLERCPCGGHHDEAYKALPPVPPADYRGNNATRPAASCYHCLRTYDNQYEHDKLDLFDALVVLRLLLDGERNPPAAVVQVMLEAANRAAVAVEVAAEVVWEPYDGHDLAAGERCRLRDGTVFRYNPDVDAGKIPDIESTEQE